MRLRSVLFRLFAASGILITASVNLFAGNVVDAFLADFSGIPANPNTGYSYGYETTLGGTLTLFSNIRTDGSFNFWDDTGVPLVGADATGGLHFGTVVTPSEEVILHPGAQGQYAVIRYTAPVSGTYSLNGLFSGQDVKGTTTDVHILVNNLAIFDQNIDGYSGLSSGAAFGPSQTQSFSLMNLALLAGNTVDFAVGYGANTEYSNDSTGLQASIGIATAPEPSSLALLFGSIGVIVAAKKKFIH